MQPKVPSPRLSWLRLLMVEKTYASKKTHGMRILTTNTIMKTTPTVNTNTALDFYSKLFVLLNFGLFNIPSARELAELGESTTLVNLDVDFETLQEWHEAIAQQADNDLEILEDIATQCFEDLAGQMRNEAVRELMDKWIKRALLEDDLFVHLRKAKDLGDGYGAVSVITNDIVKYKIFCQHPEKVKAKGRVHMSISDEAHDPD
jgi:hypothetical protein